ncbi:MAG: FAD-dependent oxidoreductase [Chloroflexi bacterium]|jgi:hypothetical protein|nr:FAD-dependent oxidoreductase [Chloroflexota bacterium]
MRIDDELVTDVLVIGGGVAGVCAAVQAARLGCDVVLVEMDEVLGGNSGPNLGVHVSGAHSFHPYGGETGIIEELEADAAAHWAKIHTLSMHYNISPLWDTELSQALERAGVQVFRHSYAREPEVEGARIKAVIVEDLATFTTRRIAVRHCVIESSGDGHISYRAGAEYRHGREGQDVYGERSAPPVGDDITLGSSVTALVRRTNHPVLFVPPPDTPPFEPGYGYAGPGPDGDCLYAHSMWRPDAEFCFLWHTETGGQLDTIRDEHQIRRELMRQLYSVWNHIKNVAHAEEARDWELVWVSPKVGRRESRRFIGDHVLTQTEVEAATPFEDAVAYGGYAIDVHNPTGRNNAQVQIIFCSIPPLYSVPYRSLYSSNVDNLLLGSRLISVSHLAHGTTRLQRTLATVGQAVGAAAGLCCRHGCTPREVYRDHLEELQQTLLRQDATILGVPNRDPRDLARSASVTASSEQTHGVTRLHDWLPLDRTRGVMLWDWAAELREVQVYLRNASDEPRPVTLRLGCYQAERRWKTHDESRPPISLGPGNRIEWGNMDQVSAFQPVASAKASVPGRFEGWVSLAFDQPVPMIPKDPTSDEDSYALLLDAAPNVFWGRDERYCDYARRAELEPGGECYRLTLDAHLFRLTPAPPYGEARNVINGWNRRYSTNPVNMWISAADEPLPQALTLTWPEPQTMSCVQLTFDTLYRAYLEMPINRQELGVAGMCVRDYELQIWRDGGWQTIVTEQGNHRRHRVHCLEQAVTTDRLRLVVLATNELGWPARVYEIRVYND